MTLSGDVMRVTWSSIHRAGQVVGWCELFVSLDRLGW